ncbi:hypothetical protein IAT40_001593 [Kwoniella sp. CBS 6097]
MAFDRCALPNCMYQALVDTQRCTQCRQYHCFEHVEPESHRCPVIPRTIGSGTKPPSGGLLKLSWEPEVSQIMSMLDADLIKLEVETLRPGHTVSHVHLPDTVKSLALGWRGSCNFHIEIDFEDGSNWMMRIRRRVVHRMPDAPLKLNIESEVATKQVLQQAGVAVPRAYLPLRDSRLHHKLLYSYQEFIPGQLWTSMSDRKDEQDPLDTGSINHVRSLAEWFISMEKASFDKIGSPTFSSGDASNSSKIVIGPQIERRPAYVESPYYHGPFMTPKERWLSSIDTRLTLLRRREYCTIQREVSLYLALLEVKSLVQACEELDHPGPYYIKHDDDRSDHIKSREDGTVTYILDWEWAYTTNKEDAFCSPIGWVHKDFLNGKNDQLSSPEQALVQAYVDQGRLDLAECVRNGRKYHRLTGFMRDMTTNIQTLNATRRAFLGQPDDHPGQPNTREEWLALKKEEFKDDEGLKRLLANPVVIQAEPSVK